VAVKVFRFSGEVSAVVVVVRLLLYLLRLCLDCEKDITIKARR